MQVSTKIFNKQAVQTFDDLTAEIQQAQKQIATGKKIQKPSDDPVLAVRSSVVKEQLSQADQHLRNIDLSEVKLSAADSALDQVQNLTTRAYELSLMASTATNAQARQSIAIELEGLLDSIRDLANSTDASGSALFGGYKVDTTPFVVGSDGSTSYVGDRGAHSVKISENLRLQTTIDGAEVFQRVPTKNGFGSIFTMLDGMISDLEAGDASDLPIDDLKSAVAHVADQRARIGSEMNKADNQRTVLENRRLLLTEDISSMEDADIAELVTKLQTLMMNKDAAQQAFARISQMTLFDLIR